MRRHRLAAALALTAAAMAAAQAITHTVVNRTHPGSGPTAAAPFHTTGSP